MLQSSLLLLGTGAFAAGAVAVGSVATGSYSVTRATGGVDVVTEIRSIKTGSDALKSLLVIQNNLNCNTSLDELLTYLVDTLKNEIISEDVYVRVEGLVNNSDFVGPESFALVVFYSACQRAVVESSGMVGEGFGEP